MKASNANLGGIIIFRVSQQGQSQSGYDYHVALITATATESAGVKTLYKQWQEHRFDGENQTYYTSAFERDGIRYKVVFAQQGEMGMTAAAVLSMKLIQRFRPRYLLTLGIAAGVSVQKTDEQFFGDVVVADMIWNYAAGKFVSADSTDIQFGGVGFLPRPTVIQMDPRIREYVELAANSSENQCHIHIGPMACGSTVVANREILDKQVYSQFPHTIGLDMESYAVMYAAENAAQPQPYALVIKGVSDYADGEKSDDYQKFAAYTSAEFAKLLYEKFLPLN